MRRVVCDANLERLLRLPQRVDQRLAVFNVILRNREVELHVGSFKGPCQGVLGPCKKLRLMVQAIVCVSETQLPVQLDL